MSAPTNEKKIITDVFIEGSRKGWQIAVSNIIPNVLMAFVIIHALKVTGVLTIISKVFGSFMGFFGLPGEAAAVLMGAWMSMGGGVGVVIGLFTQGILNGTHIAILTPAIFLMGAQLQYAGRLLGSAEVESKHYGVLFGICILNAFLSMLIMQFFV